MFMYTTFFKSLGSVRFFIFLYIITVGQKPCNSTLKPVATGAKTNFSKKKKKNRNAGLNVKTNMNATM